MNTIRLFCAAAVCSAFIASSAFAGGGSIQAFGSWWDSGDVDTSFGGGIRGTIGDTFGVDLGWTYYAGDDYEIDTITGREIAEVDGIDAHAFDLGFRYTFPIDIYLGGGASYYVFDSDLGSTDGKFGVYGLVGWSFGGEHLRGFVEGMYRYTETTLEIDGVIDTTWETDISYDGVAANVGIMYRF